MKYSTELSTIWIIIFLECAIVFILNDKLYANAIDVTVFLQIGFLPLTWGLYRPKHIKRLYTFLISTALLLVTPAMFFVVKPPLNYSGGKQVITPLLSQKDIRFLPVNHRAIPVSGVHYWWLNHVAYDYKLEILPSGKRFSYMVDPKNGHAIRLHASFP